MNDDHLNISSKLLRNGSLAFFLDTSHLTILNNRKSLFSLLSISSNLVDSYVGVGTKTESSSNSRMTKCSHLLRKPNARRLGWKTCKEARSVPTNRTHSIVTAVFVPVGLARSNEAAQGGIKLFSAVHVHPNILLRRGTEGKKGRKKNECGGRSWQKFPEGCQGEGLC